VCVGRCAGRRPGAGSRISAAMARYSAIRRLPSCSLSKLTGCVASTMRAATSGSARQPPRVRCGGHDPDDRTVGGMADTATIRLDGHHPREWQVADYRGNEGRPGADVRTLGPRSPRARRRGEPGDAGSPENRGSGAKPRIGTPLDAWYRSTSRALSAVDRRRRARPKRIALASDISLSGHGALPAAITSQSARRTRGPTVAVGKPKPALNSAAMERGAMAAQANSAVLSQKITLMSQT